MELLSAGEFEGVLERRMMSSRVECVIPLFDVRNLELSIAFYMEHLGFVLDWGGKLDLLSLARRV